MSDAEREDRTTERAAVELPRLDPGSRRFLGALLALVVALHALILWMQPPAQLWGDEPIYAASAREDAAAGTRGLLPGQLRFEHRPEFGSRLLSWLVGAGADDPTLLRRASWLNLLWLLAMLVELWLLARLLGLSRGRAGLAVVLLASFPWFGFYVHTLWPELLHGFLLLTLLLGLAAHLRDGRLRWLVVAGLATAYAMFTKGVVGPFCPMAGLVLLLAALRRSREKSWRSLGHAALPALVYVGTTLLVVTPQWVANARAGHGAHLAANRWWNLEVGLRIPPEAMEGEGFARWLPSIRFSRRYMEAGATPEEREQRARERVLAYVENHGLPSVFAIQARKLGLLLFRDLSGLEQSFGYRDRWGGRPPEWVRPLLGAVRFQWYALLLLGLLGFALAWGRDPARLLVGAFFAYYSLSLLAVPEKLRLVMPLVPLLSLYAASLGSPRGRQEPAGRK